MILQAIVSSLLVGATAPPGPPGTPRAPLAQEESAAAEKELQALVERYNAAQEAVYEAYAKAESDAEKARVWAGRPGKEYVPEFRAVAEKAPGTDTAARAWIWAYRLSEDPKEKWGFVETLLEQNMESPALAELSGELRYAAYELGHAKVVEALRAMVAESPHDKVRAGALFTLGAALLESKTESDRAEGRDCLEAVVAEYGELPYRGATYADAAQGYLYELDHLQIGMVAPDFETVDENGAKWKLSDYRGKVVIVDFWGYW